MFEIPDDDDLFLEDNILCIETNKAEKTTTLSRQLPLHGKRLENNGSTQDKTHCDEIRKGVKSPQCKRLRVLSNINSLEANIGPPTPPGKLQTFSKQFIANIDSSIICDGEGDALPRRRSQRRFPGPAGLLPLMKPTELETEGINISDSNHVFENKPCRAEELHISNSQASSDEVFAATSWQSLKSDLEPDADEVLKKFSVRVMLHRAKRRQLPKGKVPLMLGIIDSIDFTGIDAGVVVRDQTGQMQGTLHRDVLRDFGAELQAGAAIVLRQVSVISPSSRTHYLNITSANVVAIYPSQGCTGQVILPGSLLQSSTSGQTAQQTLKTYIHTADVELIEEGNKRMENTLVSMRQRMGEGTLPQAPTTPWSVRGNQPHPNTMTECRVQCLPPVQRKMSQGTPSGPLTPQYQFVRNSQRTVAQPAHSSSSSRFTFKNCGKIFPSSETVSSDCSATPSPSQHFLGQQTGATNKPGNVLQHANKEARTDTYLSTSINAVQIKTPNFEVLANCKAGIAASSPSTSAFVPKVLSRNNRDNEVSGCLVKSSQSSSFSAIRQMEIACPNTLKVSSGASNVQGESSTGQLSFNLQSTDVSESIWFDELNDDILSQLSDDF